MIRAIATWSIVRSLDRARTVPRPLRPLLSRSRALRRLELALRNTDAALRAGAAGLVDEPPPDLAARTLARLRREPAPAPARSPWSRLLTGVAAVGGLGAGLAAAAIAGAVLLRVQPAAHPPTDPGPAIAAGPAAPAPQHADASPPLLLSAALTTPFRAAAADPFSATYLAEARRLREDTQAAAGFLLDRLRIIGVADSSEQ